MEKWICINGSTIALECFKRRHMVMKLEALGLLGVPVPRCDKYGNYDTIQCHRGMCWCADPDTGVGIPDTISTKTEELNCDLHCSKNEVLRVVFP